MSFHSSLLYSTVLLFATTFLVLPSYTEQASFEDVRCKCVCPKQLFNGSGPVYIKNVEPNLCKCENVVTPVVVPIGKDICQFCECKYESRNTATIKVVVIFIICVVSMLFVYMLFLMCLDPLIQRRPAHYSEHTDEVNLEDLSVPRLQQMDSSPTAAAARQRSILNRVTDEQKKWKGTVQEQRRNIYDRHTMLN